VKRLVLAVTTAALFTACEQAAPPTAPVRRAPDSPLLDISPATASTIRVSVLMDGRSRLILRGNTVQWFHIDHAAPGRWAGRNEPTTINGLRWVPEWPGQSGEVRCGGCFSSVFAGLEPALPAAPVVLKLTPVAVRSVASIVQQPTASNDYTAIIELDDNGPFGGATYTVDISFTYAPPTASAGGPYAGPEGTEIAFDGSGSSAAGGGALTYAWDFGDGTTSSEASPKHAYSDNGVYDVTLTVTDASGSVTSASTTAGITNVAPTIGGITAPAHPRGGGANVSFSASFTDPGGADTHSAVIDWGDGTSSAAAIGVGTASGTHTYGSAGVYTVTVTVSDDDRGTSPATLQYLLVSDPAAGFVPGGGWIDSPAGAYAANPALAGKASFGFVARYQRGATTPSGNTAFEFTAGGLNFKATSYEWLVIAGSSARYKGEGTVNGAGRYGFMLTAVDGGSGVGADAFRIKIWDAVTSAGLYDNKLGAAADSDDATALGGGSIVIHR